MASELNAETVRTSMILDCESYASARQSICEIFGISDGALVEFLTNLDRDKLYKDRDDAEIWTNDALISAIECQFETKAVPFDRVAWFHLTRTNRIAAPFAEGILALTERLQSIWQMLISIPGDTERSANLATLKKRGVPDRLYVLKADSALHSGPYAMLVRESAFCSTEMGNHDYLRMPEIIEDICNGYEKQFGKSILAEVGDVLTPCIVKFEVRDASARMLLEPALQYCWCKANGQHLHIGANTCFDGRGEAIPAECIKKIEFLPIA
jgi:hypothetical protein